MYNRQLHISILLTAGILLSFNKLSFSQEEDDSLYSSSLMEYQADEVVITAQYEPVHYKNSVNKVKVIKPEQIQRMGLKNLSEVLNQQLNFRIQNDLVLGSGVEIRGLGGENVQIMIDGVPMIGRLDGNIDLSQVMMVDVERIEIVEGAMSSMYGSNAAGGVVNIVTKKNQYKNLNIKTRAQLESQGNQKYDLITGIKHKDILAKFSYSYSRFQNAPDDSLRNYITVENEDGTKSSRKQYPWNPKHSHNYSGLLRYDINDELSMSYNLNAFNEKVTSYGRERRPQFKPYAIDQIYRTNRMRHTLNFDGYLNENLYIKSISAHSNFNRKTQIERTDFENDSTYQWNSNTSDTAVYNSIYNNTYLSYLGFDKLKLQAGLEINHETAKSQRILDTAFTDGIARQSNFAGWLGFQYSPIPRWKIDVLTRFGYNTEYDHPVTPTIKTSYRVNEFWNLRAGYAFGFRAPSLKELHFNFIDINHFILGNQDLSAERFHNMNISARYERNFGENDFSLETTAFYNQVNQKIILAEYEELKYTYLNLEKYNTHGASVEFTYDLDKTLSIRSSHSLIRIFNEFSMDYGTDRYIPNFESSQSLSYTLPLVDTRANISHRYFGKEQVFFLNDENKLQSGFIEDYHFLDFSLSKKFWKERLFISAGVRNLLDVDYLSTGSNQSGTHSGPSGSRLINLGRNYFITVELDIHKDIF